MIAIRTTAVRRTGNLCFKTKAIIGRYKAIVTLEIGLTDSEIAFPLINITVKAGITVIEINAEAAMANVLVNANGLNNLPDCPCSTKTGRNEIVIIKSEKNKAGPTSLAESIIICILSFFPPSRSEMLVSVFYHYHQGDDHYPDSDSDTA